MNVVPVLGQSFNEVFPILVGFLCLCNLLNVYSRLVQLCGLDALEFEWAPPASSDASDLLAEGRRLIESEGPRSIPLRLQIAQLIEEGTLPCDWNAHSQ